MVIPLAPQGQLIERFATAARARIDQVPAEAAIRLAEVEALHQVSLGQATSRSVLGSMTHFGYAVESWLETKSADDLDALGLWLCDTPCFPLETHWPWLEAELILTGAVAPGRSPFRYAAPVT